MDAAPGRMREITPDPPHRAQANPPFVWPVRVYWEDTDAGGVVFYANYLKFFERARTEWLRALGLGQQALRQQHGGMFVVAHTELRHLLPARLDDELAVTARLTERGRVALALSQQAWRGGELLCAGRIRIGWVNTDTLRPARIPADLLAALPPPIDTA